MGITGLLPFLKSIQKQVNISLFRGKKVAVDAYCWLHRGAYSCPMELVMGPKDGEKIGSLPFLKYCTKRVKMLLDKGVTPVIVFDGSQLPIKSKTEAERRKRRKEYREKGRALLKDGKRSDAHECFQKCIDVSPEMAHAFIKACHEMKVECIVAPYEADSQLAYLSMQGIVDLVITEDSDLLVFGCKKVLFKMDEIGGGVIIDSDDFGKMKDGKLANFTLNEFRQMCILSGCDYLTSVPGIGLSTAHKLMKKYSKKINNVIKVLKFDKGKLVPPDYWEKFQQAELTFKHQLVFDPRSQQQVPLTPLPEGTIQNEYDFAGAMVSPRKAVGLARGNINPLTHELMDTFSPSKIPSPVDKSKQKRWSSSAMSTSYLHYSTPIQANLDMFSSSEKSRRNFKPPRRIDDDTSSDNATLLSYYSSSTGQEAPPAVVEVAVTTKDERTTPSDTPNTADKSHTITISRFFAGQNGRSISDSCTPHNPFSVSKPAAAMVARKLDLSGNTDCIERENVHEHLQRNVIEVIEQSPVKELCSGSVDVVEDTSTCASDSLDDVSVIQPPTPVKDEDTDCDKTNKEGNSSILASLPLQQGNGGKKAAAVGTTFCYDNNVERKLPVITKKLGHRDLTEFAFRNKSERVKRTTLNDSGLTPSLDTDGNFNTTPASYRGMENNTEELLCPLERKKCKIAVRQDQQFEDVVQPNDTAREALIADLSTEDTPCSNPAVKATTNKKTMASLSKSFSFSVKKTPKATRATTVRSLSCKQLNLNKFAYTPKKSGTLR